MLDTLTQPNTTDALAASVVADLLAHFATALPWLDNTYGLAQVATDKDGQERFPRIYRNDGTGFSHDIRPDQRMKALLWFEHDAPDLLSFDDGLQVSGAHEYQLGAVVWLNLPLIDPLRTNDFTGLLMQDFLRALQTSPLGTDLTPERIDPRIESVFERYRWEPARHQLLQYPYSGFRIPFTVRQETNFKCIAAFTPLA